MFQRVSVDESQHGISLSGFVQISKILATCPFLTLYLTSISLLFSLQKGTEDSSPRKRLFTYPEGAGPADFLEEGENDLAHNDEEEHEWEDEPVNRASLAIAAPEHRGHIKEHLAELLEVVKSMEDKSNELLEVNVFPCDLDEKGGPVMILR